MRGGLRVGASLVAMVSRPLKIEEHGRREPGIFNLLDCA